MKTLAVFFATTISLIHIAGAAAAIIDFEDGFADLDPVGVVAIPGNTVTFSVGPSTGPTGTGFIALVGNPATAFLPADTPAAAVAGEFFLTDEASGQPFTQTHDYFIDFADPVLDLALDLFDYRGDGGAAIGDTATLNAYADAARSILVGSDTFTVPAPQPVEGNVVNLSIPAPSAPIAAAHLVFSGADVGTGIDNISFSTSDIPEPAALAVWSLLGLTVFGACWRRRRRTP